MKSEVKRETFTIFRFPLLVVLGVRTVGRTDDSSSWCMWALVSERLARTLTLGPLVLQYKSNLCDRPCRLGSSYILTATLPRQLVGR